MISNSPNPLLTQLQSLDVRERSQAVLKLVPGSGTAPESIMALVTLLCTDDDLNVVEDATWVLVRHGPAATTALLTALPGQPARARHNLVHALGKLADRQAVPALISASADPEPAVRLKAVYALGQIGEPQALDALIARLDDPVENVRWTAREVIQRLGGHALPHLTAALSAGSETMRELAANLLGDLGDVRAIEPLVAALNSGDWQVRFAIVEALGAIGDARALPALHPLTEDTQPPVWAIANAVIQQLTRR
jgi:HEAT repeat protein